MDNFFADTRSKPLGDATCKIQPLDEPFGDAPNFDETAHAAEERGGPRSPWKYRYAGK